MGDASTLAGVVLAGIGIVVLGWAVWTFNPICIIALAAVGAIILGIAAVISS